MALEAVNGHCRIIMTRAAKVFRADDAHRLCIRSLHSMTGYAFFKAILLAADAFAHGLNALMLEHGHMIASHKLSVTNAVVALAPGNDRCWHTIIRAHAFYRPQQQENQANRHHHDGTAAQEPVGFDRS